MRIVSTGRPLFARVEDVDLSKPLDDRGLSEVIKALGDHGVLCFPGQDLSSEQLRDFSAHFGSLEINVGNLQKDAKYPEVMVLSNIVKDGKPIGVGDAGQDWHTDMSYSKTVAFVNVRFALEVPCKEGRTLGETHFSDMAAAWDALPQDVKATLEGRRIVHDFEKFWEMMRREKNSPRPALTDAQRRAKPPVPHLATYRHPVSGRQILYANPGYSMRIEGMPEKESDELLAFLFRHQTEDRFVHRFSWTKGDVLMWDNLRVIHKAIGDYGPETPRYMKRCQVMADKVLADMEI